jgi:molybdopterin-binding protein
VSLAAPAAPVRWVGAQRDVLAGGIEGLVDLRALAGRPHLYALGPLEGCRGEVSVFAGVPSIATVVEGRNVIKGRIVEVVKGATTAHVKLDVGGGPVITASIANEAVDELRLTKGDAAYAGIKASDVMVGKD